MKIIHLWKGESVKDIFLNEWWYHWLAYGGKQIQEVIAQCGQKHLLDKLQNRFAIPTLSLQYTLKNVKISATECHGI